MTATEVILNYAVAQGGTFLRKNLLHEVARQQTGIKASAITLQINRMLASGSLHRVGRGVYALAHDSLPEFVYQPSVMEKDIYLNLKQKFPLLDVCIWSPRVLASFMHHVPDIGYVFVDVEKDGMETVFHALKEMKLDRNILLSPSPIDCDRYLNTGLFYDNITSDMTVNPKNNQSFTIPFEESPKIAFTTNYVPADFDPSSEARLLYMVFSDYYHQKTEENDYRESRSIRDDFGKDLFSRTYSEDEWNQDLNFILQCVRFYLSVSGEPVKLLPPMANIIFRKHKQDMGANFEDWAQVYFHPDSGRLDTFVPRTKAFEDFKAHGGKVQGMTSQKFLKKLEAFALLCPWVEELNPAEVRNNSGRIIRREEGAAPGSSPVEMIYMKKKPDAAESNLSEAELWAHEHGDEAF